MKAVVSTASDNAVSRLLFIAVGACLLFAISLFACTGDTEGSGKDARILELERSIETLTSENTELQTEIADLRARLEDLNAQIQDLKDVDSKANWDLGDNGQWDKEDKEQWAYAKDGESSMQADTLEQTVRLVEDAGGQVHYIDHAGRGDRTVLVTPEEFVEGQTPLIVSLHGFGGNSFYQSMYIPLHERVNADGFALLLPNGVRDAQGNRFWNPTDHCCEGGKSGEDDVAYLTELVAEARKIREFGHIYFFGYSNGGFMSHHVACKGLHGLRAIASLAGTSYVEDSSCEGAPPVSVLQIHGTDDSVIMFGGAETDPGSGGERAFYLGAVDMVTRWSRIAGCEWPEDPRPYEAFDFDQDVPGLETEAFELGPNCADGINIELWRGNGSNHGPGYAETFIDALLDWLLDQK